MYEVLFIDYGNKDIINIDNAARKLPAHLLAYEPQAFPAYLAYLQVPRKDQKGGDEAAAYLKKTRA